MFNYTCPAGTYCLANILLTRERIEIPDFDEQRDQPQKKRTKGTTTVIMDTEQKIQGLEQVSNENFYKPLETPLVSSTAVLAGNIVKTLFDNRHIDNMTYE